MDFIAGNGSSIRVEELEAVDNSYYWKNLKGETPELIYENVNALMVFDENNQKVYFCGWGEEASPQQDLSCEIHPYRNPNLRIKMLLDKSRFRAEEPVAHGVLFAEEEAEKGADFDLACRRDH